MVCSLAPYLLNCTDRDKNLQYDFEKDRVVFYGETVTSAVTKIQEYLAELKLLVLR